MALLRHIITSLKGFFVRPSSRVVLKKNKPKLKPKASSSKKKISRKNTSKKKSLMKEILVGEITHFFTRIQVVVVKITRHGLQVGDTIHVKGRQSDFTQKVGSLQIESVNVQRAKRGQLVGLKVGHQAKEGDRVFKVS